MNIVQHRNAPRELAAECDRLLAIAEAMPAVAERRQALIGAWYERILDLTQQSGLESTAGEQTLDAFVSQLRRAWMATAHEHADVSFRSPAAGEERSLPSGLRMSYGYERSLESTPLDVRLPAYRPVPAGWSARHLLFSSGMAALSAIVQSLPASMGAGGAPPSLLVAAAYFETLDLISLGTHGCATRIVSDDDAFERECVTQSPEIAFIEPIVYDPWLRPFDVARAARMLSRLEHPPVLVIDSTLVGPSLPITRILDEAHALPLVIQASSGLKLDQVGLELANVGIVSVYASDAQLAQLDAVAEHLTRVRRLNGTSLTVDTVALLDLPFFLDPAVFYDYCEAVFEHNTRLAMSISTAGLFQTVAHPSLDLRHLPWAQAPFVFFHLRDDCPERYVELETLVMETAAARGLALERGGSFGFRGHRCEAIVLESGKRTGVFKVALGARAGPSVDGIIKLMMDIAAWPTVADARAAMLV